MKYSVLQGQQKEKILQVDGIQSICPYTAPIPLQGNMGQIQIMRMPCSSQCPLAELNEAETEYTISCGSEIKKLALEPKNGHPVWDGDPKIIAL